MPEFLTVPETAERAKLPRDWIRAACHRGEGFHQLPHVRCGEKRPIIRIEWEQFGHWLEEETDRQK